MDAPAHVWYALAWLSFGLLHSVLAARSVKDGIGRALGRYYRLAYNGFAVLHLGAVWGFGRHVFRESDGKLYRYTGSAWTASVPTVDLSGVAVSNNGIELQDREFFAAIRESREPNASVAQVLPCYQVLHQLEQQFA